MEGIRLDIAPPEPTAGAAEAPQIRADSGHVEPPLIRHGRACPGHPRLACGVAAKEDVDARDKRGHDEKHDAIQSDRDTL
jgi:hypothetical protein